MNNCKFLYSGIVSSVMFALVASQAFVSPAFAAKEEPKQHQKQKTQKEAKKETKQVEIKTITIDKKNLEKEREINKIITSFYDGLVKNNRSYGFYEDKKKVEADIRQVAYHALMKNLKLRQTGINKQIARKAVEEARAVFDPVINFSVSGSNIHYFTRTEYDDKYKKSTDVNNRVYMPDGSPVEYLQYNAPRPAGHYLTKINAVEKPLGGNQETLDFITNVNQSLPWGQNINLNLDAKYKPKYWMENADTPERATVGQYKRPWTIDISGSFSTPFWGAKDFGENNAKNTSLDVSKLTEKLKSYEVENIINQTLLEVDSAYWDLVLAVKNLKTADEIYSLSRNLYARTNKMFNAGRINRGDRAQVLAQLDFSKSNREQAFREVTKASNLVSTLANYDEIVQVLPIGYTALLEDFEDQDINIDDVLENPEHMKSLVNVAIAKRVNKTKQNFTKPDVTFNASLAGKQSDSVYGYVDIGQASQGMFDPDTITASAGVSYYRPLFNKAAKKALEVSNSDLEIQESLYKKVRKSLERNFNESKIKLESAKQRYKIASKNKRLASSVYQRARRLQRGRKVSEYEVTQRLKSLLEAKQAEDSAKIEVKKAQTKLLSTIGALVRRYGEKTAQTAVDKQRIKALSQTNMFNFFVRGEK